MSNDQDDEVTRVELTPSPDMQYSQLEAAAVDALDRLSEAAEGGISPAIFRGTEAAREPFEVHDEEEDITVEAILDRNDCTRINCAHALVASRLAADVAVSASVEAPGGGFGVEWTAWRITGFGIRLEVEVSEQAELYVSDEMDWGTFQNRIEGRLEIQGTARTDGPGAE